MRTTTAVCFAALEGVFMMMSMFVSCCPVPEQPWTQCKRHTATLPASASLLYLMKLLTSDFQSIEERATNLIKVYTTQQPGESQPRVTSTYVRFLDPLHLPNFPYDYKANPKGNTQQNGEAQPKVTETYVEVLNSSTLLNFTGNSATSTGEDLSLVLPDHYKELSRVAIYCHAMIKNEEACDQKGLALTPMDALKDAVYSALCHVDLTVRKLNFSVTSYENKDAVVPDEIKVVPDTCPAERVFYDYMIFKDTAHYAAKLKSLYSDFSGEPSSGQ